MIKSLLSFILLVCFFWFFPDVYLWTRNFSNALFQEAANVSARRVEIKVSRRVAFLPERFGVLGAGEKDYYVELFSESQRRAVGTSTQDGTALIPSVTSDTYVVRVATLRPFSDLDLRRNAENGEPLLLEEELIQTSLPSLTVTGDVFAVAVLTDEDSSK